MTIKKLLKDPLVKMRSIAPNTPIAGAISMLAADDTSALLVTTANTSIEGILSSSDIVRYLNRHRNLSDKLLVRDLMTKDVVTCDVNETVQRLELLMTQNNVRHIPITDAGVPVTLVSIIDVTRYRLILAEGELSQIRDYVSGTG